MDRLLDHLQAVTPHHQDPHKDMDMHKEDMDLPPDPRRIPVIPASNIANTNSHLAVGTQDSNSNSNISTTINHLHQTLIHHLGRLPRGHLPKFSVTVLKVATIVTHNPGSSTLSVLEGREVFLLE
jgi:hypothetical protein